MVKLIFSFLVLALSTTFAFADTQKEIAHLLKFVETTDCSYQRNGSDHDGKAAVAHIQKKYDYYSDDIKTAEDFIAYSATKSAMTGKKYTISCANEKIQFSGDWLNAELKSYRGKLNKK